MANVIGGQPHRANWQRERKRLLLALTSLLAFGTVAPTASHAQSCITGSQSPCFQGLGFLAPNRSPQFSTVFGISPNGAYVVGYSLAVTGGGNLNNEAFGWSGGSMTGLGFLNPSCLNDCSSQANAVNDNGTAVGYSMDANGQTQAFAGGPPPQGLGFLNPSPSTTFSVATAISNTNVPVGLSNETPGNREAVIFSNPVQGIGYLAPLRTDRVSTAFGVNSNGQVIVGSSLDPNGFVQAFRWVNGTMSGLGFLPGFTGSSVARAVNSDGRVVVGYSSQLQGNDQAFSWANGTMTGLGFLPGTTISHAFAVNSNGTVVVGDAVSATGQGSAFRWTPADGMKTIEELLTAAGVNFTGWRLFTAKGVSADGRVITGTGFDPSGHNEGWIARLPLPASLDSLLAAVAPNARTTTVGTAVTGFATIINAGAVTAMSCSIALPGGVSANFLYQTTDPQTNTPVGTANTPVDIAPGKAQTFYFAITPNATFSQDIPLVFSCVNSGPAPVVAGLNTFLLTASNTAITDMLSIADTPTHDGIANIPGTTGTGLIATAAIDIGAGGTVTFTPTPTPFGQPARSLGANLSICQTNNQGMCINPATPGPSSTVTVTQNQTVFFSVFIQGIGTVIPFDPANTRVFILGQQGSAPVGEASAAVRTQ